MTIIRTIATQIGNVSGINEIKNHMAHVNYFSQSFIDSEIFMDTC
jgi:hypothetical protein